MRTRVHGFIVVVLLAVGVLVPASASAEPPATNFGAVLSGDEVVPGPGAPDGSGNVGGTLWPKLPPNDQGSFVCAGTGNVQGAERPFTAHIHAAPAGQTGPIVATLEFGEFGSTCGAIDRKVLRDITENFDQYYFDIHTAQFPDGALRGQLQPH